MFEVWELVAADVMGKFTAPGRIEDILHGTETAEAENKVQLVVEHQYKNKIFFRLNPVLC